MFNDYLFNGTLFLILLGIESASEKFIRLNGVLLRTRNTVSHLEFNISY